MRPWPWKMGTDSEGRKGAPDPTIRFTLPPPTVVKGPGTFPFSITIVIRWLVNILH